MPKKDLSGGFTKAAQNNKFVRHRDVKMKESELKKEAKIQKSMSEGICRRCRDKVQWRFQYDKYKPLKAVATCQNCKNKCVTKAYHSFCGPCAKKKEVCPSCCKPFEDEVVNLSKDANMDTVISVSGQAVEESEEAEEEEDEGEDEEDEDAEDQMVDGEAEEHVIENETSRASGWVESVDAADDFIRLASQKYSKTRAVGTTEDKELAFKFSGLL